MIPPSVKAVLWSYDPSKIDLERDKKTIVSLVLNLGSEDAISWLFNTYGKKGIADIASSIPASAWDKKSLSFWSLILNINPPPKRTFI